MLRNHPGSVSQSSIEITSVIQPEIHTPEHVVNDPPTGNLVGSNESMDTSLPEVPDTDTLDHTLTGDELTTSPLTIKIPLESDP